MSDRFFRFVGLKESSNITESIRNLISCEPSFSLLYFKRMTPITAKKICTDLVNSPPEERINVNKEIRSIEHFFWCVISFGRRYGAQIPNYDFPNIYLNELLYAKKKSNTRLFNFINNEVPTLNFNNSANINFNPKDLLYLITNSKNLFFQLEKSLCFEKVFSIVDINSKILPFINQNDLKLKSILMKYLFYERNEEKITETIAEFLRGITDISLLKSDILQSCFEMNSDFLLKTINTSLTVYYKDDKYLTLVNTFMATDEYHFPDILNQLIEPFLIQKDVNSITTFFENYSSIRKFFVIPFFKILSTTVSVCTKSERRHYFEVFLPIVIDFYQRDKANNHSEKVNMPPLIVFYDNLLKTIKTVEDYCGITLDFDSFEIHSLPFYLKKFLHGNLNSYQSDFLNSISVPFISSSNNISDSSPNTYDSKKTNSPNSRQYDNNFYNTKNETPKNSSGSIFSYFSSNKNNNNNYSSNSNANNENRNNVMIYNNDTNFDGNEVNDSDFGGDFFFSLKTSIDYPFFLYYFSIKTMLFKYDSCVIIDCIQAVPDPMRQSLLNDLFSLMFLKIKRNLYFSDLNTARELIPIILKYSKDPTLTKYVQLAQNKIVCLGANLKTFRDLLLPSESIVHNSILSNNWEIAERMVEISDKLKGFFHLYQKVTKNKPDNSMMCNAELGFSSVTYNCKKKIKLLEQLRSTNFKYKFLSEKRILLMNSYLNKSKIKNFPGIYSISTSINHDYTSSNNYSFVEENKFMLEIFNEIPKVAEEVDSVLLDLDKKFSSNFSTYENSKYLNNFLCYINVFIDSGAKSPNDFYKMERDKILEKLMNERSFELAFEFAGRTNVNFFKYILRNKNLYEMDKDINKVIFEKVPIASFTVSLFSKSPQQLQMYRDEILPKNASKPLIRFFDSVIESKHFSNSLSSSSAFQNVNNSQTNILSSLKRKTDVFDDDNFNVSDSFNSGFNPSYSIDNEELEFGDNPFQVLQFLIDEKETLKLAELCERLEITLCFTGYELEQTSNLLKELDQNNSTNDIKKNSKNYKINLQNELNEKKAMNDNGEKLFNLVLYLKSIENENQIYSDVISLYSQRMKIEKFLRSEKYEKARIFCENLNSLSIFRDEMTEIIKHKLINNQSIKEAMLSCRDLHSQIFRNLSVFLRENVKQREIFLTEANELKNYSLSFKIYFFLEQKVKYNSDYNEMLYELISHRNDYEMLQKVTEKFANLISFEKLVIFVDQEIQRIIMNYCSSITVPFRTIASNTVDKNSLILIIPVDMRVKMVNKITELFDNFVNSCYKSKNFLDLFIQFCQNHVLSFIIIESDDDETTQIDLILSSRILLTKILKFFLKYKNSNDNEMNENKLENNNNKEENIFNRINLENENNIVSYCAEDDILQLDLSVLRFVDCLCQNGLFSKFGFAFSFDSVQRENTQRKIFQISIKNNLNEVIESFFENWKSDAVRHQTINAIKLFQFQEAKEIIQNNKNLFLPESKVTNLNQESQEKFVESFLKDIVEEMRKSTIIKSVFEANSNALIVPPSFAFNFKSFNPNSILYTNCQYNSYKTSAEFRKENVVSYLNYVDVMMKNELILISVIFNSQKLFSTTTNLNCKGFSSFSLKEIRFYFKELSTNPYFLKQIALSDVNVSFLMNTYSENHQYHPSLFLDFVLIPLFERDINAFDEFIIKFQDNVDYNQNAHNCIIEALKYSKEHKLHYLIFVLSILIGDYETAIDSQINKYIENPKFRGKIMDETFSLIPQDTKKLELFRLQKEFDSLIKEKKILIEEEDVYLFDVGIHKSFVLLFKNKLFEFAMKIANSLEKLNNSANVYQQYRPQSPQQQMIQIQQHQVVDPSPSLNFIISKKIFFNYRNLRTLIRKIFEFGERNVAEKWTQILFQIIGNSQKLKEFLLPLIQKEVEDPELKCNLLIQFNFTEEAIKCARLNNLHQFLSLLGA